MSPQSGFQSPPGNIIIAWNDIYLKVVRGIGGAPGPLARMGALMHLAMYEAVNRLMPGSAGYPNTLADGEILDESGAVLQPGLATEVPATCAAYAACFALAALLKDYVAASRKAQGGVGSPFDPFQVVPDAADHSPALLLTPANGPAEVAALAYGQAIAKALLKQRETDSTVGLDMTVLPDLEIKPGEWRDTGSGPALTPNWGKVPLFLLKHEEHPTAGYHPTDIGDGLLNYKALLASPMYAAQMREVKRLGEVRSADRTAEQTEIAFFWANDLNGTSKPPGQLYTITQVVAKQQSTLADLLETARLFAMVGTAMVNASIVAWHVKYFNPETAPPLRLWRPETAIQRAAEDDNPATTADPDWQPLSAMLSGTRFSPNFPAYVSGHSTFGAAHAAAMKAFYHTDNIAFTATTEDPHAAHDANGIRRTRSFTSFTQAALENGRSRVYLGVHYQFDASGGYEIGTKVGEDTAKWFSAKPVPAGTAAAIANHAK